MATESFAGDRITGTPGRKFQLRGGGVPTTDIPNLPKADLSMPTANYPSIPTIRYQEMSQGGQDWSRRAGQLQQQELPSSFEHGAKRIAAAAGTGEMAMGKAVSAGSEDLAKGMARLGAGLTTLQENLSHETLKSVGAKEDNAYDVARSAFDVRAAKEGIAPADYQKQFWDNEGKDYLKTVESLKPEGGLFGNLGVKDDLESKVAGRQAGFAVYSNGKLADEIHNSNVTAHKFRYDNALAENRFDDARTALTDARAANTINDGEMTRMKGEIKTAEDKWYSNAVVTGPRPDIARDEAKKILDARPGEEGKASALFPKMDKVEARRIYDEAEKAVANKEKTAGDTLLKRAREGNATEAQIREAAKLENVDPKTTDSIVKSTSENRPYNEGKAATAMAVVKALDFRDPKTALKELRDVKQLILDTTDKQTQDTLLKEVDQKWEARDKPTTIQQEEVKSTSRMIESWFPTPEEMKKLPEAERNQKDKERMELHMEQQRFLEANPEFDAGKLRDHLVDKHTPKLQENSQKAVNKQSNVVVDTRRPYLGASGTPIVPTGPVEGSPEWIAAKREAAMKPKGTTPEAGYKQVAGGYIVSGEPGENVEDNDKGLGAQTPSPTPVTLSAASNVPAQKLTEEGGLTATQMPPGKLLPSKGLSTEGTTLEGKPVYPAEPVQGYTPSPTPATMGGPTQEQAARMATHETVAKPPQPPVAVTSTGEAAKFSHVGGALSGKQDAFKAAGQKYGIEPELLMAISAHETGNGTSEFLTKYNNPGGLMDPKTDWSEPQKFATLEEGIDAFARNLKEKYFDQGLTSIEAIAQKYAPTKNPDGSPVKNDPRGLNKLWPSDVKAIYAQLKGEAPAGQPRETVATAEAATPEEIANIDERSRTNIATLKPEAQKPIANFMARAIKWGNEHGVKVVVVEGYRSPERQNELYAQGRTKPGPIVTNARAGQSRHQSARAVDVAIIKNGKVLEGKEYDKYIKELGKMGVAMGLEWGGNFKSIYDPDHFQFNG